MPFLCHTRTKMTTLPIQCSGQTYTSIFLITFGIFLVFIWPPVLEELINNEMKISPTSTRYKSFKQTPVPIYLDFYFFNWTNSQNILTEKPKFQEIGPYRFYERRHKVNITWNQNGTISYRQMRSWYYSPEHSKDINDLVTSINPVALTAAYGMREYGFFTQRSLSMALGFTRQNLEITRSVRQLLFEGYEDNLMNIANRMPARYTTLSSPFDKFAWFYKRNGSHIHDGWFNMDTGNEDINRMGDLKTWNYKNQTGFYSGNCGKIQGSSGELFSPHMTRETKLTLFSVDLCRSMSMEYDSDVDVGGLDGIRFVTGLPFVDNGTRLSENMCYCNGECVPSGLLNLTSCRYGAPVFLSLPHFYKADPSVLHQIEGMSPSKEKHDFYITMEPTFGIPVDIAARIQINLLLQPMSHMTLYRKVPRVFIPVLWLDQRIIATDKIIRDLNILLAVRRYSPVFGVLILLTGIVFLVSLTFRRTSPNKPT